MPGAYKATSLEREKILLSLYYVELQDVRFDNVQLDFLIPSLGHLISE